MNFKIMKIVGVLDAFQRERTDNKHKCHKV